MIVVGFDPRMKSHTACVLSAVSGELLGERCWPAEEAGQLALLAWARGLGDSRLWAIEDCRHVSRRLERFLLLAGERVVRVAPRLIARERRRGRRRGKSDWIDALAAARAALAEPGLPAARLEGRERELALLVDFREQLVAERTRSASRLRWLIHELGLGIEIPAGGLDRRCWLDRVEQALTPLADDALVLVASALLTRLRELREQIHSLERSLSPLVQQLAAPLLALPGCGLLSAAKLASEIAGIERFPSEANSRCTPAAPRSKPPRATSTTTGSTAPATANSTAPCTASPSPKDASTHQHAPTSHDANKKAKPAEKHSAASNATSHASSTAPSANHRPNPTTSHPTRT